MFSNMLAALIPILLISTIDSVESLQILGLFPHPGASHFHFFHPIMRGLADAGHDVTVVGHFPDKNAPLNYKNLKLPATNLLTNSVDLEASENKIELFHLSLIGLLMILLCECKQHF